MAHASRTCSPPIYITLPTALANAHHFPLKTGKIRPFFRQKRWSNQRKTVCFPAKFAYQISTKSAFFSREFVYENPAKFDPFTATDQKLCPILSPTRPLENPFHHELTPVFSCRAGPSSYRGALTSCRKNIQEGRSRKLKFQEAIPSQNRIKKNINADSFVPNIRNK